MQLIKSLLLGTFFGFVLVKAEVVSWFRIQEMFRFESFHMYGVIGSAVLVGIVSIWLLRTFRVKSLTGEVIAPKNKPLNVVANITGGIIFGLGWALTGACPGPLYALLGSGHTIILVVIVSAMAGVHVTECCGRDFRISASTNRFLFRVQVAVSHV